MESVTNFRVIEYNSSEAFVEKIQPLLDQLYAACKENNVQMTAMFCCGVIEENKGESAIWMLHSSAIVKARQAPAEMYAIHALTHGDRHKALSIIQEVVDNVDSLRIEEVASIQ